MTQEASATKRAQQNEARPHSFGQEVFKTISTEDVDWEPFPSVSTSSAPRRCRGATVGARTLHDQGQGSARREANASQTPRGSALYRDFRRLLYRTGR